eukprot:1195994-Prorocentrum_minimum.AAC.6
MTEERDVKAEPSLDNTFVSRRVRDAHVNQAKALLQIDRSVSSAPLEIEKEINDIGRRVISSDLLSGEDFYQLDQAMRTASISDELHTFIRRVSTDLLSCGEFDSRLDRSLRAASIS